MSEPRPSGRTDDHDDDRDPYSDDGAIVLRTIGRLLDQLAVHLDQPLNLDTDLSGEIGVDSLALVELIDSLEGTFDVTLSDDALVDATTPRAWLDAIRAARGEAIATPARSTTTSRSGPRAPRPADAQIPTAPGRPVGHRVRQSWRRWIYVAYAWAVIAPCALLVWLGSFVPMRLSTRWDAGRRLVRLVTRLLGVSIEVDGVVPTKGPVVLAANHASFLDGLALFAACDAPVVFVTSVEIERQRVVGRILRRFGSVFVERGDPRRSGDAVDELVVVDNGSTPAEAAAMDAAAARDGRVRVLRGQGNVGFATAANLGARAARGRMLVFLNPDAFLEPGCIAALGAAVDPAISPCLVGARVMNPDGAEQRGARRGEVTPLSTLLSLTGLASRVPALARFEIHQEAAPPPAGPTPVPTVSGACFAMTAADFAAVGGFDEGYFLHVEDIDLCWRVRRAGGAVLFQPVARVVHLGSTSQTAALAIEVHKGFGLGRYFRKRADTVAGKALAWLMLPAIIALSVARAGLRARPRRD